LQIVAGCILGPAVLNIIPFVDALRLFGKIGVMMLVVESGLGGSSILLFLAIL
jgi:hypothetical protein